MRYKYKALRDRDGRERGENYKSHSNKEKKKGEALCVEMQIKKLSLLLSNASKIPHLYLLSILALSYIAVEPSKKQKRQMKN